MRIKPRLLALFFLFYLLVVNFARAQSSWQSADDGLRFLLVRWAGEMRKLKNYYDLSKTGKFLEPQLFNDEFFRHYKPRDWDRIGLDIITDDSVRYGVYEVWKVRVMAFLPVLTPLLQCGTARYTLSELPCRKYSSARSVCIVCSCVFSGFALP
jgi:hypothetical protein